jgi:uncharacterized protein (TIGR02058 family)
MEKRVIIEMGMGNNLHRQDYQKAAERAINDALRHSTLSLFGGIDIPSTDMRVQVTIGVQKPEKIDADALIAHLPRGKASVNVVKGGQDVTNPESSEVHVIATAAIEAFLPDQSQNWRQT